LKADPYDFHALVCITSCQRGKLIRRYLPHYAAFCRSDPRFSLVVSLDGTERPYLDFCKEWEIPLLYSEEREGVGLAKNRAFERFPDFDHYFFIEDDVELIDGAVFPLHIEMAVESGIHHFSLFEPRGLGKPVGESTVADNRVVHARFGGADFNFFTREGLEKVGGWHPLFARYRRWGHTEHSYRFPRVNLAPEPFNVAVDLTEAFTWHAPPQVTRVEGVEINENQIALPEQELMAQELEHVRLQTLAAYHLMGEIQPPVRLASALDGGDRYPLIGGRERQQALSDHLLWQSRTARSPLRNAVTFARLLAAWPGNPAVRKAVKARRRGRRSPGA